MIPGIVVAIDPGTNYGWSTWLDGRLHASGRGQWRKQVTVWLPGLYADLVVVEYPTFYPGDRPGQANSLIRLAYIAGQLSAQIPLKQPSGHVETVRPAQWKGSVPKKIHHERIRKAMAAAGMPVPTGASSDQLDAIGLGLWAQTHLKGH